MEHFDCRTQKCELHTLEELRVGVAGINCNRSFLLRWVTTPTSQCEAVVAQTA
jgi:hypothetical protein